ncbi:hypothetical protein GGU10DRAFT_106762 [Lentinula aff. detonsa]|uniref:Uncharacterized protein n=1 Tax=Lentinula aff. detonsa TaxID=2804958 RepID=A0AA38KDU6_9AGAR|nr:hypothetical protein GGU10DRAFT_106762 [Lentinula aff. detonsa]
MATNDTSEDGDPGAIVFGITEPMFILVMFELFFYGAYTMLFGLYVYLQIHQRGRQRCYQISLLLLYLLATAAVVILIMVEKQMTLFTLDVTLTADINDPIAASHFRTYASLTVAADGVYVAANIIADALLLYRCYIVWASRKYIIAIPVLISLINTVIAIIAAALVKNNAGRLLVTAGVKNSSLQVASIITDAFLSVNLFTNLMLTCLIAGRIWWIARATRQALGVNDSNDKSINSIAAMVLESGLLYPIALIFGLALTVKGTVEVQPMLTLIVGIAPTLIMVRTDLGISIEDATSPDPDETVALYDLEATNFDPHEMPKETEQKNSRDREGYGFQWGDDMKGKTPAVSSLSHFNSLRDDVVDLPPAFSESQDEGSSTSGPLSKQDEKYQARGLIVLNPPAIDV